MGALEVSVAVPSHESKFGKGMPGDSSSLLEGRRGSVTF